MNTMFVPPRGWNQNVGGAVETIGDLLGIAQGVKRLFTSDNGTHEPPTSFGLEDMDQDGIPDILEGGADCDQIHQAYEVAKAAKKAAMECLNGGPMRRRRRRRMLTKGDMEDLAVLKSMGLTKAELAAIIQQRVRN